MTLNINESIHSLDLYTKIAKVLKKYNMKDVIISIYTLNSWLPNNRASFYKLYIINSVLLSLEEREFDKIKIKTYKEFVLFCNELIHIMPQYMEIEDYVFEAELGEIKYFFDNKYYSVFGTGIYSYMYEYYSLFQTLYCYIFESKNFKNHLKMVLEYLEKTIEIISINNSKKEIKKGNFEVPSFDYWKSIQNNYSKIQEYYSNQMLIIDNLETKRKSKNLFQIIEYWEQEFPLSLSLKCEELNFPIFSREIIINLLFIYKEKIRNLIGNKDFYKFLKLGISDYIINRFNDDSLYLLQIFDLNNKKVTGEIIYDFGFVIEDELYLFFTSEISDSFIIEKIIIEEKRKIFQTELTFLTHYENKIVSIKDIKNIKFYKILIKLPPFNQIIYTKNNNFEIITSYEFFYIFDEIKKLAEYKEYELFLEEYKNAFSIDKLDLFATFKDTKGEIIKGAEKDMTVFIESGTAEDYRYRSLEKEYSLSKYIRYGHPRNWEKEVLKDRIELYNMRTKDFTTCIEINKNLLFISLMKEHLNEELIEEVGDFPLTIASMIGKYFIHFKGLLKKEMIFLKEENILIKILPSNLIEKKEFDHLKCLESDKIFNSDCFFNGKVYMVRVLIDIKKFREEFIRIPDNTLEIELFLEILNNLNCKNNYSKIAKILSQLKDKESEFKLIKLRDFVLDRKIYYEFIVEDKYFIRVRKEIAILLEKENIEAGEYQNDQCLEILKKIREIVNKKIEIELNQYSEEIIEYILEKLDDIFFSNKAVVKSYNENEAYRNSGDFIEREKIFKENHKVFIFILENKLYKDNYGEKRITLKDMKYLYALTKWIINIYTGIEYIYYSINKNIKLIIEDNFLFYFEERNEDKGKIEAWENYMTNSMYSYNDIADVLSQNDKETFIKNLNIVFQEKLQFSFSDLIEKLDILANYELSTEKVIKLSEDELISILNKGKTGKETLAIIQELLLDSKYLGSILEEGNYKEKGFIPYDEINKRPYRLLVKPLIKLNGKYYFSRYICQRTINVFFRHIANGKLPYRSQYKEIQIVIDEYAKIIQNNMVTEAIQILKLNKYEIIHKEVDLRKLDKKGNHPLLEKLGDYDVLVFDPQNNVVLNIECKYISQDFCGKDLKNTMIKIFGKDASSKSYIGQILKREDYLKNNINQIINNLNYNYKKAPIKIISIFLTYTSNVFLKNPLIESNIEYVTLKEFDDYLKKLLNYK